MILIGGVDAPALFTSTPSDIRVLSRKALEEGIDILAPGCAIPPNTQMKTCMSWCRLQSILASPEGKNFKTHREKY